MRIIGDVRAHTLEEHDELRALSCHREEGREGKCVHAPLVDTLLYLVLNIFAPGLRLCLREHPVAHIEEDNDCEEHRDAFKNLLSRTGLRIAEARRNPVEDHSEYNAEQHAESRADVDRSQILSAVCLDKIGDNRGNDQNGLKSLSERKAENGEKGLPGRPVFLLLRRVAAATLRRRFAAVQGNCVLGEHAL